MGQPQNGRNLNPAGARAALHPRYAALASHYVFNPLFCTPRRGNEKPDVENTVRPCSAASPPRSRGCETWTS